MPTIDDLRLDIKAVIMRCCLHPCTSGLDHQADAILRLLDERYFSLAQMEEQNQSKEGGKIE
jgi:hypothetical protein